MDCFTTKVAAQENKGEIVYHIALMERVELLDHVLLVLKISHDWMCRTVSSAMVLQLENVLDCLERHGLVDLFTTQSLIEEAMRHRLVDDLVRFVYFERSDILGQPTFILLDLTIQDLYGYCKEGFDQICPDWEMVLADRRVVLHR